MFPTDPAEIERARQRVIEAFRESKIEKANQVWPSVLGGTKACWRERQDGVEIVFAKNDLLWGRMECVLDMKAFGERSLILFPDDTEAIQAIAAVIEYLRFAISTTLFEASNGFQRRASGLLTTSTMRGLDSIILKPIAEGIERGRKEAMKRLRGQQELRGGSVARLEEQQRKSLHRQYDYLFNIGKRIKKTYQTSLNEYTASHIRSGLNRKLWQDFWAKYAIGLYEDMPPDFLILFSEADDPSASEVAYRWLASLHDHKRSYVERLILESRKEAGKPKRRRKPTIKDSD